MLYVFVNIHLQLKLKFTIYKTQLKNTKHLKSIYYCLYLITFILNQPWSDLKFVIVVGMVVLTTSNGNPVDDNQNSMTAGPYGPM